MRPADPLCPVQWETLPTSSGGGAAAFNARLQVEGCALLRVSRDLRGFVADWPDDPDVGSLFTDCDTLDRVGNWLVTTSAVTTVTR